MGEMNFLVPRYTKSCARCEAISPLVADTHELMDLGWSVTNTSALGLGSDVFLCPSCALKKRRQWNADLEAALAAGWSLRLEPSPGWVSYDRTGAAHAHHVWKVVRPDQTLEPGLDCFPSGTTGAEGRLVSCYRLAQREQEAP